MGRPGQIHAERKDDDVETEGVDDLALGGSEGVAGSVDLGAGLVGDGVVHAGAYGLIGRQKRGGQSHGECRPEGGGLPDRYTHRPAWLFLLPAIILSPSRHSLRFAGHPPSAVGPAVTRILDLPPSGARSSPAAHPLPPRHCRYLGIPPLSHCLSPAARRRWPAPRSGRAGLPAARSG